MIDTAEEIETGTESPPESDEIAEQPALELPKAGAGRPKKEKAERHKPFPKPPRARAKGGLLSPEKFFVYWRGLNKTFMERCMVYVYREYPKMNYMLALTPEEQEAVAKKKRQAPAKNIAQFVEPFESEDWRDEMLRRFGEGDYKLWLNDTGIKGDPKILNMNIVKAFVSIRDEEHPPVIEDLRCVDPNDPINASYIEKLKMAGRYGQPQPQTTEDEDMAAAGLQDVVKDMAGKMIEMAGKQNQAAPAAPPAPPPTATDQASIEAIKVMGTAFNTIEAQRAKLADPDAAIDRVIKVAEMMIPKNQNNGNAEMFQFLAKQVELAEQRRIEDLKLQDARHARELEQIQKMNDARIASIEERLKSNGPTVQPAGTAQNPGDFLDQMINPKEKFDSLTGGSESPIPGWMPYALQGLKIAGDVAMNIAANVAVAKAGTGKAVPPAQTTAEIQEPEQAETNMYAQYAREIHPHLTEALEKKIPGNEFAARLILKLGDARAYDYITSNGPQGVMTMLSAAPEVWGTFQRYGAGRQNEIFVEQFCNREAVMQAVQILQTPKPVKRREAAPADGAPAGRVIIGGNGKVVQTEGPVIVQAE